MKRPHRRAHVLIWLFVAPALALSLFLALSHRPLEPVNEALPEILNPGEAD